MQFTLLYNVHICKVLAMAKLRCGSLDAKMMTWKNPTVLKDIVMILMRNTVKEKEDKGNQKFYKKQTWRFGPERNATII